MVRCKRWQVAGANGLHLNSKKPRAGAGRYNGRVVRRGGVYNGGVVLRFRLGAIFFPALTASQYSAILRRLAWVLRSDRRRPPMDPRIAAAVVSGVVIV